MDLRLTYEGIGGLVMVLVSDTYDKFLVQNSSNPGIVLISFHVVLPCKSCLMVTFCFYFWSCLFSNKKPAGSLFRLEDLIWSSLSDSDHSPVSGQAIHLEFLLNVFLPHRGKTKKSCWVLCSVIIKMFILQLLKKSTRICKNMSQNKDTMFDLNQSWTVIYNV